MVTPVSEFTELVSTISRIYRHITIHNPSHNSVKLRKETNQVYWSVNYEKGYVEPDS